MEKKINYHQSFLNELDKIKLLKTKPTLLLHVCCGPCFTIPYELLKDYFKISLMYNNSNIFPKLEYERRLDELRKYLKDIDADFEIIVPEYDNQTYNLDLEPYADNKEGHERCRVCFNKRLSYGFQYAESHGFDYFGTVMTISRYKNAQDINKIGLELQNKFNKTKWLPADFKKDNGYEKSLLIIKEHEMYLQEYCGCKYSFRVKKDKTI